jgi:hypothetical protein
LLGANAFSGERLRPEKPSGEKRLLFSLLSRLLTGIYPLLFSTALPLSGLGFFLAGAGTMV